MQLSKRKVVKTVVLISLFILCLIINYLIYLFIYPKVEYLHKIIPHIPIVNFFFFVGLFILFKKW